MNFTHLITDVSVFTFVLLFIRFGTLFIFFPILNHLSIPVQVKASLAFYLAVTFYMVYPLAQVPENFGALTAIVLSEILFGFFAGVLLQISFAILSYAGEVISFIMGFTMASIMDPQTGVQTPIIANILNLLALMTMFALNVHHDLIIFIHTSLTYVPLGGFIASHNIAEYAVKASIDIFLIGFSIAFPVVALSLLLDVIFGMLMKTMPQFNLLVIGFPIKISISFFVIIAIVSSIIGIFEEGFLKIFNDLPKLFYNNG